MLWQIAFHQRRYKKIDFLFVFSLREDQGSMDRDMQKTKCIIEAIGKNGFKTKWPYTQYTYFNCDNGIVSLDDDFQYPSVALEFVKNLYMECSELQNPRKNCQSDCQKYLSRWLF